MSRSDRPAAQLSTYSFPDELRVDELLLRAPREQDVDVIAPAFQDPAIGGEAGACLRSTRTCCVPCCATSSRS